MSKHSLLVGVIVIAMAFAGTVVLVKAAPATEGVGLRGSVQSASGKAVEGVVVSARSSGKTYTTSVFTDDRGEYSFPTLEKGRYRIWAQAVGFQTGRGEIEAGGAAPTVHDFKLQTLQDFSKQLTGTEWYASLPEDTVADRRMKMIFRNNCSGCHTPSFILQNRFDQAGWRKIIDVMETVGIYGDPPRADRAPVPLIHQFKDELAAYLAKMRGPGPSPMKWSPLPRPRGEAAQVVITEYDYTSSANPNEYVTADGSDWMEGAPSAYEARGSHDAEVDPNGFVWIADAQANSVRTVSRLDPRTGEIKNFKLPGEGGLAKRSHGIVIGRNGVAWFNAGGGLGKIDTKTEKVEWFDPPRGMARAGGTLDLTPSGDVCVSTDEGALKFDPAANQFTEFKSKSRGTPGRTYGVATDADGNCWWAQMNYDKLGVGNFRTGEITEVGLQPVSGLDALVTERDRNLYKTIGPDWNSATPWTQAPRRLGGDKNGNTVWVALWWGNALAKIDIRTHKVAYYRYPGPGFPGLYDTVIDKKGLVWMNMMNADAVARFDPKTEKWTEFPLPSRATENRFVAIDDRKDPVEVWIPYWRTHKIARIQFRTAEQLRAQR